MLLYVVKQNQARLLQNVVHIDIIIRPQSQQQHRDCAQGSWTARRSNSKTTIRGARTISKEGLKFQTLSSDLGPIDPEGGLLGAHFPKIIESRPSCRQRWSCWIFPSASDVTLTSVSGKLNKISWSKVADYLPSPSLTQVETRSPRDVVFISYPIIVYMSLESKCHGDCGHRYQPIIYGAEECGYSEGLDRLVQQYREFRRERENYTKITFVKFSQISYLLIVSL